jgi:hypothetical protein
MRTPDAPNYRCPYAEDSKHTKTKHVHIVRNQATMRTIAARSMGKRKKEKGIEGRERNLAQFVD